MKIRISELRRLIKEAVDSAAPGRRMSDPYTMGSFVEHPFIDPLNDDDGWWEQKHAEHQRDLELGPDATDAEYFGLTDEEATVPGKWHPSEGEPVDDGDLYRLGESDGNEADSFRSTWFSRLGLQRAGKEKFSIKDPNRDPVTDEPICFDCNLPGSDCDCEPHGRFE